MQEITDVALNGKTEQLLIPVIKGFMYVMTCYVVYYFSGMTQARFLQKAKYSLKKDVISSLLHSDINSFSSVNTAKYMTIINNDINNIENNCLLNLPYLITTGISMAAYIAVLWHFSPFLSIIDISASFILLLIPSVTGKKMSEAQKKYSVSMDRFNTGLKDILSGFEVVKSFGAENSLEKQFDQVNESVENKRFHYRKINAVNQSLSESSIYLVMILNYVVGAYLVAAGNITVGGLLGAVQMVNHVVFPLRTIIDGTAQYKGTKACRNRVEEVLNMEEVKSDSKEKVEKLFPIHIQDLTFGYQKDSKILEQINLTIEEGKKYAIVGTSGCGKSTFIKILMKYYDNFEGKIEFGGKDIRALDRKEIYQKIAMIQQNVIMFDDSFRNNITMFDKFTDEEIQMALQESNLETLVERLPGGLDARVEENGKNFSGGERQRISMARAFIRHMPFLIMDEATASLDNQTAYQIEQDILNKENLTALVVTHKYQESILKMYDEIIVLQHGKVIEQGSFEDLMERKEYFYSLYHVGE